VSKKKIFIHVGFPKTGTTFLQNNIFPNIKEALYLGKPFDDLMNTLEKSILTFTQRKYEDEKEGLLNLIHKILNKNQSSLYLLSHEGFLRSTRYSKIQRPVPNNILETLKRLNELFSVYCEVYFIITLRNYNDILKSYFHQFYPFPFEYNEDNFLKDLKNETKNNLLKNFYYGNLIKFIEELGLNYKVFLYENLKYKPNLFHSQLFDYIKVNHFEYKNEVINFSQRKNISRIRKILDALLNYNRKNLLKDILTYELYVRVIQRLKRLIIKPKKYFFLDQFFFNYYNNKIYDFYISDFNKLPENIKSECQKYNYLSEISENFETK
jgi:hypothetical protein